MRQLYKIPILLLLLFIGKNGFGQTYCSPSYPSGCPFSNYITNVNIGTINQSPPGCTVHDYTSFSTLIPAGVSTPISVTSSGYCGVGVAVDLNNDGDFDDAGEILALSNYIANFSVVYALSITIPAATPNGNYRMRVYNRLANSGNGTPQDSPCGVYGYGSFDDYTLIVYHQCATITAVAANPTQICTSGTTSLTCTYTSFSPATVKWYNESGVLVGTGSPFTSPVISSTSTFYAAADNGTCDTPRAPVTVIVIPAVAPPVSVLPTDTTICEGQIVTIQATKGTVSDSVIAKTGTYTLNRTPINGSSAYSATEMIYTSAELNVAGSITDIGFFKKSTNTTFNPGTVSIYMKNTAATAVTNSTSTTGYTLVYAGAWPNVGVAANTWANITLNTPFDYIGGASNLSVLVVKAGTANVVFAPTYRASSSSPTYKSSYYIATTAWSSGVSTMTLDTLRPDIKIKYKVKPSINWSPVTNLFKDLALTQGMNTADTNTTVYAHPNVTITYNAYGNLYGCSSTTGLPSHITVKDTVHVNAYDSICPGQSFVLGTQTMTTAGIYPVSFQAVNFCDSVVYVHLYVRPYITNTAAVTICQGQSYTFNGITYTTSQTGLKDTFSTAACDSIVTLNLTVTPTITATFATIAPFCSGTTAPVLPLTSTNGITGTWSPATVNNTTTGSYIFTPTVGQCSKNDTITITVTPNVTPTFNAIAPICSGSTAPVLPLTSTNGITGTWSPATVSNTATATYTFTPTAGICAIAATLTVTVSPNVTPTFTAVAPICNGSTPPVLPLTSNNGITGTWSPATVSNTTTGTYTFTPTAGLCAVATTLSVTVTPNVISTFTIPAIICDGGTAPVLPATSNNGIAGTWSPATVSNTATGTYTFTPNAGICATSATVTITVTSIVTPTFAVVVPFCKGTTAPLLATTSINGIPGTWSPAVINNLASGAYTFTPAAGVCALAQTINVVVKNPSTHTDAITICANQTPYTWNGIANATTGAVYTTTAANNCDSVVTLNLTVLAPPVTVTIDTSACGFLWYDNQQYDHSTIVRDTAHNFLGCDSFIKISHIVIYPNVPYTKVIDTLGCYVVSFEGQNYRNSRTLIDTFINVHGCDSVRRVVNITVDNFELNLSVTPKDPYKGERIDLVSSSNDPTYYVTSWSPSALFPLQTKKEFTIFANTDNVVLIEGIDENGCIDTAQVSYKVRALNYAVVMPNAFTPNGDGLNDIFAPNFVMNRAYNIKTLKVFNRYGQEVYSKSGGLNGGWDGTQSNGKLADLGTYGYFMEIQFVDGTDLKFKGDVTLIR
jgi:gliding motility-associated-like protein